MLLVDILLTLWLRLPLRSRFFYCKKIKLNYKIILKINLKYCLHSGVGGRKI